MTMEQRPFGRFGGVSALTLGGGGLGQLWGKTTREECVATAREAVDTLVSLLDMAPSYGDGEAERVIGEAFEGRIPDGVRVTTKCRLGNTPPAQVYDTLRASLEGSLERMRLERVDLFFIHTMIVDGRGDERATPRSTLAEAAAPAFARLKEEGLIRGWGLTGIGHPDTLISVLREGPRPDVIQVVANLLDSPGGLKRFNGPARPRAIMEAAGAAGVPIMGIRAVQAGALTDGFDRAMPHERPDWADYERAAPFRAIAAEVGHSPAFLAHQYALSLPGISTVVLGVKNRTELRECVEAMEEGYMDPALMERIDRAVGRQD
jgi:aryl-alcohol dehydrogenase-like predicted oxidoreductase